MKRVIRYALFTCAYLVITSTIASQETYIIKLIDENDYPAPFYLHKINVTDLKSDNQGILKITCEELEKYDTYKFQIFFQDANDAEYLEKALVTCPKSELENEKNSKCEKAFVNEDGFTLKELCSYAVEQNSFTFHAWDQEHGFSSKLYELTGCKSDSNAGCD